MKKKVWAATPFFYLIVVAMLLMTLSSWFYNKPLFFVELIISIAALAAVYFSIRRFQAYAKTMLESANEALQQVDKNALENFSLPVVVTGESGDVVWFNTKFLEQVCGGRSCLGESITQFTSGKSARQIINHKGMDIVHADKCYSVFGTIAGEARILYFLEDTLFKQTVEEYKESRPCVSLIMFDNREELSRDSTDGQDAQMSAMVENTLQQWASSTSGFFKKLSGGWYLVVMEERSMREIIEKKFAVLDEIRSIKMDDRRCATVSIGVGRGGKTFRECEIWARKGLEMALGRGGDQAAVKTGESYQFFGGVSKGVEKRDKVRTRVIASALADHIKQSDHVFIMGHHFSDLDSVGASIGMWSAITKAQGKEAHVIINKEQTLAVSLVQSVESSGNGSMFFSPQQALDRVTENTLLIVVDTHSPSFVESEFLYRKCKRVIVIDHHRMMVNHIENTLIFYHEPYASSASEMVTELVQYMGENALNRLEAEALLAGITLDTKNFVLKTGVRTFEAAAFLRRKGADTVEVKRLFADSIDTYKAKYQLVSGAEIFNSCAIACADENCPDVRVASAQAADELLGIQEVQASFVLYPSPGVVNISARSLGAVNVQLLMEALDGGGHQTMAGAQIPNVTMDEARERLIQMVNELERKK